jgi:predicted regulator of amino acid metabolism with ACT domain
MRETNEKNTADRIRSRCRNHPGSKVGVKKMIQNILPGKQHDNTVMVSEDVHMSFEEIGKALGISRYIASRAFYSALKKIRNNPSAIKLLSEVRNDR